MKDRPKLSRWGIKYIGLGIIVLMCLSSCTVKNPWFNPCIGYENQAMSNEEFRSLVKTKLAESKVEYYEIRYVWYDPKAKRHFLEINSKFLGEFKPHMKIKAAYVYCTHKK